MNLNFSSDVVLLLLHIHAAPASPFVQVKVVIILCLTALKGLSSRLAFAARQRLLTAAAGTDSRWQCRSHSGHSACTQRWVCRRVCPSSSWASCGRTRWDSCQAEASCSHAVRRRWPLPSSSLITPRDDQGRHGGAKTQVSETLYISFHCTAHKDGVLNSAPTALWGKLPWTQVTLLRIKHPEEGSVLL